jgi:hypothetical protein
MPGLVSQSSLMLKVRDAKRLRYYNSLFVFSSSSHHITELYSWSSMWLFRCANLRAWELVGTNVSLHNRATALFQLPILLSNSFTMHSLIFRNSQDVSRLLTVLHCNKSTSPRAFRQKKSKHDIWTKAFAKKYWEFARKRVVFDLGKSESCNHKHTNSCWSVTKVMHDKVTKVNH